MPDLKRGLFGYTASSVEEMLADRERMFRLATAHAGAVEQRAGRLASELEDGKRRLDLAERQFEAAQELGERLALDLEHAVAAREAMEGQLVVLHEELGEIKMKVSLMDATIERNEAQLREASERAAALEGELAQERGRERPSTPDELQAVLQVTEKAVVAILDSTRQRADRELRDAERERDSVRREIDSMRAWRDRATPMIRSLRSTMDDMRGGMTDIGVRIAAVLDPVNTAADRLASELASLDAIGAGGPDPGARAPGARVIELPDEQSAGRDTRHDPWP
jgi:chromosome segregation ATPase